MFLNSSKLEEINLNNIDTSNVTTMYGMFYNCFLLSTLDLKNFNTNNVNEMYSMFAGCISLKIIYVGENWIVKEGTDIRYMFNNCGVSEVTKITS